jgi:hypothetical protein
LKISDDGAYSNLFEPGYIGKVKIRNRIVMLPMGGYFPTSTNEVGKRSKAYFVEKLRPFIEGGCSGSGSGWMKFKST